MSIQNELPWEPWTFDLKVAANKVFGVAGQTIYAINPDIDTITEDVWEEGGVLSFLASAEKMDIVSSSSDDDGNPLGDGARTITIFGLDDNYQSLKEEVVMNGITEVATQSSFIRINRMVVSSVGNAGVNAGTITATASTAGTPQAKISASLGSTLKSQCTVPAGYTGFIKNLTLGTENNDRVLVTLQTRTEGGAWITRFRLNINDASFYQPFNFPIQAPSKSDIRVQAVKLSGSGTVSITSNYDMYFVINKYVTLENFLS